MDKQRVAIIGHSTSSLVLAQVMAMVGSIGYPCHVPDMPLPKPLNYTRRHERHQGSKERNRRMKPRELAYRDEDDLGGEYCNRVNCHACEGTQPESYEPNEYGCSDEEKWVAKHANLIAGPELSEEEWATLAIEGEHKRPDLFKRTEWEDEHPEDYDGPCFCRECRSCVD